MPSGPVSVVAGVVASPLALPRYTYTRPVLVSTLYAPTARSASPSPLKSATVPQLVSTGAERWPTKNSHVGDATVPVTPPATPNSRQKCTPADSVAAGMPLVPVASNAVQPAVIARSLQICTCAPVTPAGSDQ